MVSSVRYAYLMMNSPLYSSALDRSGRRTLQRTTGDLPGTVTLPLHDVVCNGELIVGADDLQRLHRLPGDDEMVQKAHRPRSVHRLVARAHHAHELAWSAELAA